MYTLLLKFGTASQEAYGKLSISVSQLLVCQQIEELLKPLLWSEDGIGYHR